MPLRVDDHQRGFTLLEVLVALAVVAIALGALIAGTGTQTRNTAALQERTFAHWVAMNRAAELEATPDGATAGARSGSERMAGREWHWRVRIEATDDPDVQRAHIEVRRQRNDEQAVATLTSYLFRPQDER